MTKIIVHQSLELTEDKEPNPIGKKLLQHLSTTFPISKEKLHSDRFYYEDMARTYGNKYEQVCWLMDSIKGDHMKNIKRISDEEDIILLWGSGEVHFVSQYISLRKDPYHKLVWDRHHDDMRLDMQLMSAGMVIPRAGGWLSCERESNLNMKGHKTINKRSGQIPYQDKDIHASVDLDVIKGFPARYDWQIDDGVPTKGNDLTLDELAGSLELAIADNNLRRFDIGGLHLPHERDNHMKDDPRVVDPIKQPESLDFAIECYETLIKLALER